MKINRLKIEYLRNITNAEISPLARHNIITGKNGAGKTTLLEAIFLLARAKSFLANQRRSPIAIGQSQATVFAELSDRSGHIHKLGLSKSPSEIKLRFNGSPLTKLSALANTLPISLITPNSHRLIEDGPDQRRRLLNWGVFHVEHEYKNLAARLNRTLLQRNNALRKGTKDLSAWDQRYFDAALSVHQQQRSYFKTWSEELTRLTSDINFLDSLTVKFIPGWQEGSELSEIIKQKEANDRERGFTTVGPHRADIEFKIQGTATKQILSRGQQKVLITCALEAQAKVLERETGKKSLLLFDDLDSELDMDSLEYVFKLISKRDNQNFITTINPEKFRSISEKAESGMFHVEHGCFS